MPGSRDGGPSRDETTGHPGGRSAQPLALPPGVELFESSSELAAARVHDVLIVVWRTPMNVARIRRVATFNQQMQYAHARFGVIVVVEPGSAASPDAATREATARLTESYEGVCAGVALVVEGTGIKYTVIRLAIATIQLVSTQRVPQPVFDSLPQASRWMHEQLASTPEDDLIQIVTALRTQPAR